MHRAIRTSPGATAEAEPAARGDEAPDGGMEMVGADSATGEGGADGDLGATGGAKLGAATGTATGGLVGVIFATGARLVPAEGGGGGRALIAATIFALFATDQLIALAGLEVVGAIIIQKSLSLSTAG